MRRNAILIFCVAILTSNGLIAQEQSDSSNQYKTPFLERLYWDGNVWLTLGSATHINIAPKVGYKFNDRLSAGLGGRFQYVSFRDLTSNYKDAYSTYGASVFGRYIINQYLFLHSEWERMNINQIDPNALNKWTDMLLVGAAIQKNLGGYTNGYFQILYDVMDSPYLGYFYPRVSLYHPIIIRLGFSFGI